MRVVLAKFFPCVLGCLFLTAALPGLCRGQSPPQTEPPDNGNQVLVIPPGSRQTQAAPAKKPAAHDYSQPNDVTLYEHYGQGGDDTYFGPGPQSPHINGPLPYLGIAVDEETVTVSGRKLQGLQVVSVDPHSPAAAAGLKPAEAPTTLGASGATASTLLGPAALVMVPLLRETGQLGAEGDLIVAADDHRIASKQDLADELAKLKPGDTLWLTVMRGIAGGHPKSIQVAVRLGPMHKVADAQ